MKKNDNLFRDNFIVKNAIWIELVTLCFIFLLLNVITVNNNPVIDEIIKLLIK